MTTDINKLLERLRTYYGDDLACRMLLMDARHALEAMAGERDRTRADYEAMKAHNKELFGKLSAAEAERDRLKAALEEIKRLSRLEDSVRMSAINQLADKALGGDAS